MAVVETYSMTNPTIFGEGAISVIGEKAKEFGCNKVLIVTDAGLVTTGIVAKVQKYLEDAGIKVLVFDKIMADPTDTVVDEGGALAVKEKVDGIVGLGGGSSMDASKGIALLTANPGPCRQYYLRWDYKKGVPLILIPTTSGTGSENTPYSVLSDQTDHTKQDLLYTGTLAIVDPELTVALPPALTASTGMDAFAHAAESMTTKDTNPMTLVLGADAIQRICKWLPIAVAEPTNIEARREMALASNFAGIAFAGTCVHLGHAFSQCMGAMYHLPHGITCAWALPETMRYAAPYRFKEVKIIADALKVSYTDQDTPAEVGKKVADEMRAFMRKLNIPGIKESGFTKEKVQAVADIMFKDLCFPFMPHPLNREELLLWLGQVYDAYQ